MKILYYITDGTNGRHLDMAIEDIKKGHQAFILHCDSSIGLCVANCGKNRLLCRWCRYGQKKDMHFMEGLSYEEHWISEYVSQINVADIPHFEYKNSDELRELEYEGVEIGIGALSTYISLSRNLNPTIDDVSREYFDELLSQQVITIKILEKLIKKENIARVVFTNGRGAQFKPFLSVRDKWNVDFICTETITMPGGVVLLNNFDNDSAHSYKAYENKIQECWETTTDSPEEREKIARSFYENRKNALKAGDVVYTKNQQKGLLPSDWNPNVENIVIFGSSEDEYIAISKEFSHSAVFESQIIGVKTIAEHYLNDPTKHFTLRVHPNLTHIPYRYHMDLYDFKYPNLTVIPADSPISSYSLVDVADKIIVFGSTMGIECSYWHKPVINLAYAAYITLGCSYNPSSPEETWRLIEEKNLPYLYSEKVLQFGYFFMSSHHDANRNININLHESLIWKGRWWYPTYQKLFGSSFLYQAVCVFLRRIKMRYPAVYKNLDFGENLN